MVYLIIKLTRFFSSSHFVSCLCNPSISIVILFICYNSTKIRKHIYKRHRKLEYACRIHTGSPLNLTSSAATTEIAADCTSLMDKEQATKRTNASFNMTRNYAIHDQENFCPAPFRIYSSSGPIFYAYFIEELAKQPSSNDKRHTSINFHSPT
jgi:hypothetical protein